MPHKALAIAALPFIVIALMFAATAMPGKVVHDDPMRPLDADYHDLPEALVAQLRRQVPPRPNVPAGASTCFSYHRWWHKTDVVYCVCYDEGDCRALKETQRCTAKLGQVAPGVGVCRWRGLETVVVG